MKYIDAHCHIDWFSDEEVDIISKELDLMYAVGISFSSSLRVININRKYENIKAAIGIHPEYFEYYKDFEDIKKLIYENKDKIYAIGEVGLPYFSLLDKEMTEKKELYNEGFLLLEKFVTIAKDLDLPLVLHCTQSTSIDAYRLLKKYGIKKALFHWLNCDYETAKLIFEEGYYASVSLDILHDSDYLEFVKRIPIKNLLLESDSPWEYLPNIKSSPKDIRNTSKLLSKQYKMNEKDFLFCINNNINDLFGICQK